jgi:uncharacterized protein
LRAVTGPEALHLLTPGSIGSQRLMDFVTGHGLNLWFLDDQAQVRAFELMLSYADRPMDLADASLVVLAESLKLRKIFTLDRNDSATYRLREGHRYCAFEMLS